MSNSKTKRYSPFRDPNPAKVASFQIRELSTGPYGVLVVDLTSNRGAVSTSAVKFNNDPQGHAMAQTYGQRVTGMLWG